MADGIKASLDISRRALFAQTQAMQVLSNNIANVNTPGYTRRRVELVSTQSQSALAGGFGQGVDVDNVSRMLDTFINKQLLTRINDTNRESIRDSSLGQAEKIYSLDDSENGINAHLSKFFDAIEAAQVNPASLPLRLQVIEEARALTGTIKSSMNTVASLQRDADLQIQTYVGDVNLLASQIAEVNVQVSKSEIGTQENLSARDKRDELIRQLSENISFNSIENSDGSVSIFLESGFTLVDGKDARTLEFSYSPSFAPAGGFALGLDGRQLGHIVFDFDPGTGTSHIDLSSVLATGGGKIGGLLSLRGTPLSTDTTPYQVQGDLVDIGARIEAVAQDLLTRFNTAYPGPDETAGGAHQASSRGLDGSTPAVYGLFGATGATDANSNGLPDDLSNTSTGQASYALTLSVVPTSPLALAAALDLDTTAGSVVTAPGDGRNLARLTALRNNTVSYNIGRFQLQTTIEGVSEEATAFVGSLKRASSDAYDLAKSQEDNVQELYTSVSGVSLDEEFSNLVNFQRAFEASARMVRVSDELLQAVIGLLG